MSALLRVVELGDRASTAYCAKLLLGLGASVYKVGEESAQALSGLAASRRSYLDAGKSSAHPDDLGSGGLDARLAEADVLLTALDDEDLAVLGVDLAVIRRAHPALVVSRGSALEPGQAGAALAGDLQAQALSGMMFLVGEPGREPLRLPGPQAEYAAGLALFTGTVFALFGRGAAGATQVSTSAARATAYLDWKSQIFFDDEGKVLRRGSDSGPLVLRCADGHVGFYYRPEDWTTVKGFIGDRALEDERFDTQRGRDEHRADLQSILETFTGSLGKEAVYHSGQAAGIPVGAVWTTTELLSDPQYAARDFLRHVDGATMPRLPWSIDGERVSESRAWYTEGAPA